MGDAADNLFLRRLRAHEAAGVKVSVDPAALRRLIESLRAERALAQQESAELRALLLVESRGRGPSASRARSRLLMVAAAQGAIASLVLAWLGAFLIWGS